LPHPALSLRCCVQYRRITAVRSNFITSRINAEVGSVCETVKFRIKNSYVTSQHFDTEHRRRISRCLAIGSQDVCSTV